MTEREQQQPQQQQKEKEDTVLELVRGESMEQKLSGLILATKLISSPSRSFLSRLSAVDGFTVFLAGLLNSGDPSMLSLSAAVLSTVLCFGGASESRSFVGVVAAPLISLLCRAHTGVGQSDEGDGFNEVLKCIECLSSTSVGSEALVKGGFLRCVRRLSDVGGLRFLRSALSLFPPRVAEVVDSRSLDELGTLFMDRSDSAKFEAAGALASVLSSVSESSDALNWADVVPWPSWQESVRAGIASSLSSKIGPKERAEVLEVASRMFELCGDRWSVVGWSSQRTETAARSMTPAKFVQLVVSMSSVEVRVSLGGKGTLESPERVRAFAAAMSILERSSSFLATDDGGESDGEGGDDKKESVSWWWRELPTEALLFIRKTLVETIGDVVEFLESCSEGGANGSDVMAAAARFACVWASLDPDGPMSPRIAAVAPFLVSCFSKDENLAMATGDIQKVLKELVL